MIGSELGWLVRRNVFICIATYNRNDRLEVCLDSILNSISSFSSNDYSYMIVVVDNSIDARAVREVGSRYEKQVVFLHEATAGIPFARNKAMNYSLDKGADYIAFVDDDEYVSESWIRTMINSLEDPGQRVDVVSGNVDQFVRLKRPYKSVFFRDRAETDNVIMRRWVAQEFKFDIELRYTGGSDTLFFRQAHKAGARIKFDPSSLVYEPVEDVRDNFLWRLKRNFRYGNIGSLIDWKLENRMFTLFLVFIRSLGRVVTGVFGAVLALLFLQLGLARRCLERVARGLGGASFILGVSYREYKRD